MGGLLAECRSLPSIPHQSKYQPIHPTSVRENIVLIGFMGSGKSSIGRQIAGRLGFRFVDTDALIVQGAGLPIAEIFARDGEEAFRDLETAAIESLAHTGHCVIATGGGVVLRERNRALLRELGLVILLTASEDVIFERVSRNTRRPLLQTPNPRETVSRLLAARQPSYEAAAQWTLDTSTLSHAQSATAVIAEATRAFSWQDGG
ncbi:MAG: shikimate kinase [Chthoniobacter sp.]|jgi:shikimate kinase|nr:shikimate kinase [Chthoniobacter sp.]